MSATASPKTAVISNCNCWSPAGRSFATAPWAPVFAALFARFFAASFAASLPVRFAAWAPMLFAPAAAGPTPGIIAIAMSAAIDPTEIAAPAVVIDVV